MSSFHLLTAIAASNAALAQEPYNVLDPPWNAKGDNVTEDTAAVAGALAAAGRAGGGVVLLPAGHTFLLRPVQLLSHVELRVEGNIAAWPEIATWPNSTAHKMCPTVPYLTPRAQIVWAPQREALIWAANATGRPDRDSNFRDSWSNAPNS